MPQETLNICAAICRPCHSAVHRSHDNDTLGQSFHTVALLLADEKASWGVVCACLIEWKCMNRTTRRDGRMDRSLSSSNLMTHSHKSKHVHTN